MTTHQVLEIIDEHKHKMPDGVYKDLCDKMADLNRKEPGYARIKAILISPESSCCGDNYLKDVGVNLVVKLTTQTRDPNDEDRKIRQGSISRAYFDNINEHIEKDGYKKAMYDGKTDTYLLITSCEFIEP